MKDFRILFVVVAVTVVEVLNIKCGDILTADFGVSAIMSIVAAAIAAATAIGTGTASAVKADQAELKADINKAKNDSWFNKEYYQDSLNKKENKEMLGELSRIFGDSSKTQSATANVMGISHDLARQTNLQGNESYGSAIGDIKSNESNFKKSLLDNYQAKDESYNTAKMNAQAQKASALAGIFTGVASTVGEVAGAMGGETPSSTTNANTEVTTTN